MPGYFSYPFADDETMGFFGGYRGPTMRPLSDAANKAPNVVAVSDATPDVTGDTLTYPNGERVIDINTDQPYPRPDRLNMQDNVATGALIKQATETPGGGDIASLDLMFAPLFVHGSEMDYQRPLGHPFGPFEKRYKNLSSYNFGVLGAAAGISKS
jgi:hypothetical protein